MHLHFLFLLIHSLWANGEYGNFIFIRYMIIIFHISSFLFPSPSVFAIFQISKGSIILNLFHIYISEKKKMKKNAENVRKKEK